MMARVWNELWTAALLNHLWQSTVIVVAAWLVAAALKKNHARVRYWVWMAASAKFLLPFSLFMAAGERLRTLLAAPIVPKPAVANAMEQIAQPFVGAQFPADFFETTGQVAAAQHINRWPVILLAVWATGLVIVAVRFTRNWRKVSAARRAALPFELAADVPALTSPTLIEPGIFGIFRPVLLLPEGIMERLTVDQLRAIVEHEMCHVRRRDNLTFAIHMIVETLFWFHPAVWWLGARLIEERERACDEAVIAAGSRAAVYAESILNVCKFCVESPVACVAGVTGADLKNRILRIMTAPALRRLDWRKKLILAGAALVVIAVPVTLGLGQAAQTGTATPSPTGIEGIWQGTLHVAQANRDLRIENKITRDDKGNLKVVDYSIDQGGQPLKANKASFEDGVLKFSIDAIGGTYEGKMSPDGKSLIGNWTQGPSPLPLNMERVTADAAWPIPEPPKPMAADANPSFDVVTIKPSKPGASGKGFTFRGRHGLTFNTNMNDLISFAYGLHSKQIVGAPDWFGNDLFDIDGVPDVEGDPNSVQFRSMMQKLLADRFALKFHHEQRELAVYVITVAPGGPKMEKSDTPAGQGQGFFFRGRLGDLNVSNNTITDFAHGMQGAVLDKPVVDHTGLTDRYNFHLKWTPDDSQFGQFRGTGTPQLPPAGDDPNAPPSLYTAMPEQIGLKIEAGKAMDDVIVVDRVEKPSAN